MLSLFEPVPTKTVPELENPGCHILTRHRGRPRISDIGMRPLEYATQNRVPPNWISAFRAASLATNAEKGAVKTRHRQCLMTKSKATRPALQKISISVGPNSWARWPKFLGSISISGMLPFCVGPELLKVLHGDLAHQERCLCSHFLVDSNHQSQLMRSGFSGTRRMPHVALQNAPCTPGKTCFRPMYFLALSTYVYIYIYYTYMYIAQASLGTTRPLLAAKKTPRGLPAPRFLVEPAF